MRWRAAAALLTLLVSARPAAAETSVDLELVLAVDVSGSMDREEQQLQREGYVEAITRPEVLAAIRTSIYGRVAVTYVEWAGPAAQAVAVPWRLVEDAASAESFAAELADAPFARIRGTSISGGLEFAAKLFENNGYEGMRRVIDISGDGPNNMGGPVVPVRDAVLAQGIVINGLPIMLRPSMWGGRLMAGLDQYYTDCVIGGPGSFVLPVDEPEQMAEAIRQKLLLEIAGREARVVLAQAEAREKVDCMIGERMWRNWYSDP